MDDKSIVEKAICEAVNILGKDILKDADRFCRVLEDLIPEQQELVLFIKELYTYDVGERLLSALESDLSLRHEYLDEIDRILDDRYGRNEAWRRKFIKLFETMLDDNNIASDKGKSLGNDTTDVFICCKYYEGQALMKTKDGNEAEKLYYALKEKGYSAFSTGVSLKDRPGAEYGAYLTESFYSAKIMLVLGTDIRDFDVTIHLWKKYMELDKAENILLFASSEGKNSNALAELEKSCRHTMKNVFAFSYEEPREVIRILTKILEADKAIIRHAASRAIENLTILHVASLWLKMEMWEDADSDFSELLRQDPEDADAYLGKLMAQLKVRNREELRNLKESFAANEYYKKVMLYGDTEIKTELRGYIEQIESRNNDTKKQCNTSQGIVKDRFLIDGKTKAQLEKEIQFDDYVEDLASGDASDYYE